MESRCLRCGKELPEGGGPCPACWATDPERCPPDEEERIYKRLGALNFACFALVISGLALVMGLGPWTSGPISRSPFRGGTLGDAIPVVGAILFALGLGFGAAGKGRSVLWGFLGLLCVFGFPVLYFLGKRCLYCRLAASCREGRCIRCGAPI